MKGSKYIIILVTSIILLGIVATTIGIFSSSGLGTFEVESIHGNIVTLYGKGIYKYMSATTAPQGIAQDYVTLIIGIPLLIVSLILAVKGSIRGKILLTGTLGYFLVTYLFYLVMAMYNELFLVYVALTFASFYSFIICLLSFRYNDLNNMFKKELPVKFIGGFLITNSLAIGFLWLSRIIGPLINGTYPIELEHYTTLIVQGLDLSILLPAAFLSGLLIIKKNKFGYLFAPIYIVFLSILMTSLSGKIIGQILIGVDVGPVIFIIPSINLISWICTVLFLRNVSNQEILLNKIV